MAAGFHVLFNIFMMINIYKICTLKTEYRRILKLEKTSEGINVKLIFSNKCKHKEPKKAYNAMYASAG